MKFPFLLAIIGLASLPACTPSPRGLSWTAAFEDSALELRAIAFEAAVSPGDCAVAPSAEAIYRQEFTATRGASPVPVLAPGTYALSVRARDAECRWYARGCTTVTLPQVDGYEALVVLFAGPEEESCPERCTAGECIAADSGAPDADLPDTSPSDSGPVDSSFMDAAPMDTGPLDTGPPDTGSVDIGTPDTFVPECSTDGDCGSPSYTRTSSWSCRADGALDRASFRFTFPECSFGRCGSRSETQTLECRCRDDICSSGGCNDVNDGATRCDDGVVEGPCPIPDVTRECHR